MSVEERATRDLEALPSSLGEAIEAFAGSELMRETLGAHVFDTLLENKRIEWDEYRSQVTPFEIDRYLSSL
jgi:glutamine synthetase